MSKTKAQQICFLVHGRHLPLCLTRRRGGRSAESFTRALVPSWGPTCDPRPASSHHHLGAQGSNTWIWGHGAQHWPKLTHTCGLDAQTGAQVGDSDT